MAGLTNTQFEPGADCYVVVFTPTTPGQEKIEFLEGIVTEMGHLISPLRVAHDHPLLRYFQHTPRLIREIQAVVTDPQADIRNPIDPIQQNTEPFRHYLVVSPDECLRYFKAALGQTQYALANAYEHVRSLETTLCERIDASSGPKGWGFLAQKLFK